MIVKHKTDKYTWTESITNLVQAVCADMYQYERDDSIENRICNLCQIVGNLIDTLASRKLLTPDEIYAILGFHSHTHRDFEITSESDE